MKYGFFDIENKEYIITTPKTPVKWINYIGDLNFGGFVDQTGGALICKGDPALNRIIKYIPQLPASDFNGTTLYIRKQVKGQTTLFSPFFTPTMIPAKSYECHVGLGYTKFVVEIEDLLCEITVFVPTDSKRELRDIKITNLGSAECTIDLIPVVEYSHFESIKQFNNADWVPQTMQSVRNMDSMGISVIHQFAYMRKGVKENYFTANRDCESFETDRERFLGEHGFGSFKQPLSLLNPSLSNYEALRGNNICAALYAMGTLTPNERVRLVTQLGQTEVGVDESSEIARFRDFDQVDQAFETLKQQWNTYTSMCSVETPNTAFNNLVNIFNPRQCMITKNWSRFLSLYQLGLDTRGIGFRDTSQDLIGVMGIAPEETTEWIVKLLSTQLSNGSAMHQFFPSSMIATNGEAGHDDRPDYYGDDHLWIILTTVSYCKETGDFNFLKTHVPYYEKDKSGVPLKRDTVFGHLLNSLRFTKNNVGRHGLPLLGFADWNDCVNLPKGAESIFNANLYGKALQEMLQLLSAMKSKREFSFEGLTHDESIDAVRTIQELEHLEKSLKNDYEGMKECVNTQAWDGEWFTRYFDHEGQPLGSKVNQEGKIYTNAQSWSVFSGFADEQRGNKAMESVNTYLATKHGIKLSAPGYNGFDPIKGGVSTYPPGAKENGGIFLHANPWAIIAETLLGHGNQAFDYFDRINPIAKNDSIDTFEVEPYVFPQNILGDEHPQFGLGRNSWLSGTSSWMYHCSTNYIMGVQAKFEGLSINPCIPNEWEKFSITRKVQGDTYHIHVTNPNHVEKGIVSITLDGMVVNQGVVPYVHDGKEHTIQVVMGQVT
jgi:cellobiose phosphorylase